MKISVIRLFTFLFLSCNFIMTANAQEPAKANQQPSKKSPEQRVEKRLNKMKDELNLTAEQLPKVKEVLEAREIKKASPAESNNPDAAKEDHKQMMAELSKILTPDQMAKYKQMQSKGKKPKQ